jgi:CysZ protein
VAVQVEARHYPNDPPGKAMAMIPSLLLSAKFTLLVIAANLVALVLVLLPFINFAIFFFVNAWLIGREYFLFAAMRFRSEEDASRMRQRHSFEIFIAGLVIAGFMAVPVLNLLTPLFATAMMVHIHKAIAKREGPVADAAAISLAA